MNKFLKIEKDKVVYYISKSRVDGLELSNSDSPIALLECSVAAVDKETNSFVRGRSWPWTFSSLIKKLYTGDEIEVVEDRTNGYKFYDPRDNLILEFNDISICPTGRDISIESLVDLYFDINLDYSIFSINALSIEFNGDYHEPD